MVLAGMSNGRLREYLLTMFETMILFSSLLLTVTLPNVLQSKKPQTIMDLIVADAAFFLMIGNSLYVFLNVSFVMMLASVSEANIHLWARSQGPIIRYLQYFYLAIAHGIGVNVLLGTSRAYLEHAQPALLETASGTELGIALAFNIGFALLMLSLSLHALNFMGRTTYFSRTIGIAPVALPEDEDDSAAVPQYLSLALAGKQLGHQEIFENIEEN